MFLREFGKEIFAVSADFCSSKWFYKFFVRLRFVLFWIEIQSYLSDLLKYSSEVQKYQSLIDIEMNFENLPIYELDAI